MKTIRLNACVGSRIFSRTINLPEYPLVGDEIQAWNDKDTSAICCLVAQRSWSPDSTRLDLKVGIPDQIGEKELRDYGWR